MSLDQPYTDPSANHDACSELLLTPAGMRWLAQLLGRMDEWLDKEHNCFDLA